MPSQVYMKINNLWTSEFTLFMWNLTSYNFAEDHILTTHGNDFVQIEGYVQWKDVGYYLEDTPSLKVLPVDWEILFNGQPYK